MLRVTRSQLRQNQRTVLKKAVGKHIVVVSAQRSEDEKYIVDKRYFDAIIRQHRSAIETLKIAADPELFNSLLEVAATIDDDLRSGRLESLW